MNKAAKTLWYFGIYMIANGVSLLIAPNAMLSFFGFPPTDDVWIRILGLLMSVLGAYYMMAARQNLMPLVRWSVYGRLASIPIFTVFCLAEYASWRLMSFALTDLLAALWTYYHLLALAKQHEFGKDAKGVPVKGVV